MTRTVILTTPHDVDQDELWEEVGPILLSVKGLRQLLPVPFKQGMEVQRFLSIERFMSCSRLLLTCPCCPTQASVPSTCCNWFLKRILRTLLLCLPTNFFFKKKHMKTEATRTFKTSARYGTTTLGTLMFYVLPSYFYTFQVIYIYHSRGECMLDLLCIQKIRSEWSRFTSGFLSSGPFYENCAWVIEVSWLV